VIPSLGDRVAPRRGDHGLEPPLPTICVEAQDVVVVPEHEVRQGSHRRGTRGQCLDEPAHAVAEVPQPASTDRARCSPLDGRRTVHDGERVGFVDGELHGVARDHRAATGPAAGQDDQGSLLGHASGDIGHRHLDRDPLDGELGTCGVGLGGLSRTLRDHGPGAQESSAPST
jgi:hypothetical protein